MTSRARQEYRYEKLTWPEINDAVEMGKVCIVPCGAVEQHGPHLPLDVDVLCARGVAEGAGKRIPDKLLVLPPVWYGYTGHVMDFPGTINTHFETFIHQVLDITKSLAYHGFKKIVLLNGHGSNMPNLDLVARRTNLETDAECVLIAWWLLLTVDKSFLPRWRQSKFPGGCAHACELETSLYLYLDGDNVRKDLIKSGTISFNEEKSPFMYTDIFGHGPAGLVSWTSSYSDTGVLGEAELGSAEKGRQAYEEAVGQLVRFVNWFHDRPKDRRRDHHRQTPTMPFPWGQHTTD
jgi:creatinine amidohydrolase